MHAETRFVTEMFQAGASGYVLKMAAFDEVAGAIRTVAAGGHYASPGVAGGVIADLAAKAPPASAAVLPVRWKTSSAGTSTILPGKSLLNKKYPSPAIPRAMSRWIMAYIGKIRQ